MIPLVWYDLRMAHIFAGGELPEPDQIFQIVKTGEPFFVMSGSTEIHTEDYSFVQERVGNKWVVTYTPANGPKITFETGSRPTCVIESNQPLTPHECCEGGPQWGHAWNCPTLPS